MPLNFSQPKSNVAIFSKYAIKSSGSRKIVLFSEIFDNKKRFFLLEAIWKDLRIILRHSLSLFY